MLDIESLATPLSADAPSGQDLEYDPVFLALEQAGAGRNWITGPLERPLGRGINFQISVPSIEPLVSALAVADWPLFMAPETRWYRAGDHEAGVTQFLVKDPDGYLIRFQASLGRRRPADLPPGPST